LPNHPYRVKKAVLLPLCLLLLVGCQNQEREQRLQKKEAELAHREQELLLREKALARREQADQKAQKAVDSVRSLPQADSALTRNLAGTWAARMNCIETDCAGSAIGDSKNEQWEFSYEQGAVLVRASVNNKVVRVYTGQPLNTLARLVAVVPPHAELEAGFAHWLGTLRTLVKEAGLPLVCYGHPDTLGVMREQNAADTALHNVQYNPFDTWDDFLIFSKQVQPNDLFLIVSSRPGHASYLRQLARLPYYLATYFTDNSFLLLFPHQLATTASSLELVPAAAAEQKGVKGYFKGLLGKRK